ncbi:MAG: Gfo/Idh/MocA family oxidoreductase [Candidatus Latescibacteria bacterium]|jgi:virulence factor|nr:Gfo/Idh/MocA family oxidoreductase [Candidatus Latescibacterota bacterium]MBT4140080.1 Gfo/Idh/MocA family oxidoreductase [Candidatus Latescibacterota bacterium]MBT5829565.1 Gfo/Idh/MocA family oxidoreductase [Candidatus Latescibacterota bacterium]
MSVTETVRVAMVGAGGMANNVHYPSLASFDDVAFVGICDLNETRMGETADQYAIENRYTDYRKMVEEQAPDGIYVIGQPHYMYDIWIWCLEQGLNLYIEKPMGITWHQAQMLLSLAEEKGVITQVSHQRRSSPLLKKMREACLARGPITHAVCEFYKSDMKPYRNARDHMMDDCTHSIDTLRWMCGGEVTDIESHCKRIGTPDINWIGATLHFDNGSTGYVINSWSSGRRVFRVEMHAPNVYVDAEVETKATLYADGDYEGVEYDCFAVAGGDSRWEAFGFRDKNREFVDSLKSGKDVTTSPFRDCIKTMEVAEKILAKSLLG